VQKIAAALDSGYFSVTAVAGLEEMDIDAYIATERQKHQAGVVRVAEGRGGTGVRADQGGVRVPLLPAAWAGEGARRVASGLSDAQSPEAVAVRLRPGDILKGR
jgi:hypothetical protein